MKKRLWRGSTLQLLAIIILPLTILLVVISLVSFSIHDKEMRTVIATRDERAVLSAASAIESDIIHKRQTINALAQLIASLPPQESPNNYLTSPDLKTVFDQGIALFAADGSLLAHSNPAAFWQAFAASPVFTSLLPASPPTPLPPVSIVPVNDLPVLAITSTIPGSTLTLVAAFSPGALFQPAIIAIYPPGGETSIYMVGPDSQILYHSGPETLEGTPESHPGIPEAFSGQSGTTYTEPGHDIHLVAYSPIGTVDWALITEGSWEMVSNPVLMTSQNIQLIFVPALMLAALALWFGSTQIVRPLQKLEAQAAKLSWGDFKEIAQPVGGIAEIRDLQEELALMATRLEASQEGLHGYIGAITQGQEAERQRLARDLHDDTLQSLIALKQRLQLAGLPRPANTRSPAEDEHEMLIDQTIANLRRTTRALRPIYLEDLGLAAALETLVGETRQGSGLTIAFMSSGVQHRLPPEVELALYRMAQEALNNAVRHAQAKNLALHLQFTPRSVRLEVSDDGKGFKVPRFPTEFAPQGHFGLLGLYERAELIGARLKIISTPGKGTHLQIDIPAPA